MALPTKPDMTYVWASGGAKVAPGNTKIQTGWTAEVPPFQWENWSQNRQDAFLDHINKSGFPVWDGLTNYEAAGLSLTKGSDGKIYKSVAASGPSTTVQDPVTDATDVYWTIAFADVGAFLTQTTGDARYTQRANNLSDVTNAATARTNLGAAPLASPAFTGTPTAPTAALGTSTTQVATTAFLFNQFTGNQNLSPSGYQRLPGGLVIQWGNAISGGSGTDTAVTVTLPTAFTSLFAACTLTLNGMHGATVEGYSVTGQTLTNFVLRHTGDNPATAVYWIAVGY